MKKLDPTDRIASAKAFRELIDIMAQLRTPETGCPWDVEQTFETIYPYTIEEAYEVADAIERQSMPELKEELGDLLFQVMFHSQIAAEAGHFTVEHVVQSICEKMIRRHPHVFADGDNRTAAEQTIAWDALKAKERAAKEGTESNLSALDGVALALPALQRADKLQKRAGRVGFDWPSAGDVFEKLDEELDEVKQAIAEGDLQHLEEEIGDLLFVAANLARKLSIDPEHALRKGNAKFERRFKAMEDLAAQRGQEFPSLDINAQEALWQAVKKAE
ncbi:MAG: nucleoside triphosphate pyrophosphohydrolase [Hyphomonas sp.]